MPDNATPIPSHSPRRGLSWAKASFAGVAIIALGITFPASAHTLSSKPRSGLSLAYVGPQVQDVTVPDGVSAARVQMIGGHGGNSIRPYREVDGSGGAEINGTVPLAPGQQVTVSVAQYGGDSDFNKHPGEGGWGVGGWYGGPGGTSSSGDGAGGGGTTGDGLVVVTWIYAKS